MYSFSVYKGSTIPLRHCTVFAFHISLSKDQSGTEAIMVTAIIDARVFDGHTVYDSDDIIIEDGIISTINGPIPENATIIDGTGSTLLPGLIDSHTHTKIPNLQLAFKFGVTTELEMMGHWTHAEREEIIDRDDVADLRTADFGLSVPGGHAEELHRRIPPPRGKAGPPLHSHGPPKGAGGPGFVRPTASTPDEATAFVAARIASGADYIKLMIEEGSVLGEANLPVPSHETLNSSFNTYPQGSLPSILATVKALHDAGVDILAGTDASVPMPALGGVAHGASVHHEMQLLVEAGLTPVEALRAATSVPAKRFGLEDRGVVAVGKRADLVLVRGNPTVVIGRTLDVLGIWRRGSRVEVE